MATKTGNRHGGPGRGQGRKPLSATEPTKGTSATLTLVQIEKIRAIGGGNFSEGVRRLLARYETLIGLWRNNVSLARDSLAVARHYGADTAPFEDRVAEAEGQLARFEAERDIVVSNIPAPLTEGQAR